MPFHQVDDEDNPNYIEFTELLMNISDALTSISFQQTKSIHDILLSELNDYYTYNGSLTTPPCSEIVTWIDFRQSIPLSHSQVNRAIQLIRMRAEKSQLYSMKLEVSGYWTNRERSADAHHWYLRNNKWWKDVQGVDNSIILFILRPWNTNWLCKSNGKILRLIGHRPGHTLLLWQKIATFSV